MKTKFLLAALWLACGQAYAQFSGQISYEIVRRIDPNSLRIVINGEQVKPGDPNFPTDMPDSRTIGMKAIFSGPYIKEVVDDQNLVVRRISSDGAPTSANLGRPFEESKYLDLAGKKSVTYLTIGKGPEAKTYKSEVPVERTSGWQMTDQTKKIAGFSCKKATVHFKNETYTVWITEDLPATYSPVSELLPEKGVVLLIEGSREQLKASKVQSANVNAKDIEPKANAQTISKQEMDDIREKTMADFRQTKMMHGDGGR